MVRINNLFAVAAVIGLGMGLTASAHAQATASSTPTGKLQKPWRLKIGAFFPTDGDVKDSLGNTFFSYGVSYDFVKTQVETPITLGVYVDGATKSKDGGRLSYVGLGPSARYFFTPVVAPVRFYGGAGLGPYFVTVKAGDSKNKTAFGGKLLAGVESNQGIFGELDYTFISSVSVGGDDVKPSGFNLSVGYRF
jgi:hypothetical protein